MTPPRLTELACPVCHAVTWVIDSDDRGIDGSCLQYNERDYRCSRCRHQGQGWKLLRQSPPEFLLQPHSMYPMTQAAFDDWVEILRSHFPEHPKVNRLGTEFRPYLPEEAEADRAAHGRAHPVSEIRDQDGARRIDPDMRDVIDWADMMKPGDTLALIRRDGGVLKLTMDQLSRAAVCLDPAGAVQGHASGLDEEAVHELSRRYLKGDVAGCLRQLRWAGSGSLGRMWSRLDGR
jgi:hypothetical protein